MTNTRRGNWRDAAIAASLALVMACGDDGGSPPAGPSGGGPGPSGATITISSSGLSPSSVSITSGQSVTFVNSDSRSHEIASDPHPAHTNCPSINALGTIGTGQTKPTNSFTAAGNCGFHDHGDPTNTRFQGTITIR